MTVRTLAAFKRALAQPGASVRLIENTVSDKPKDHPVWRPMAVEKLLANAVAFRLEGIATPWWLQIGAASEWTFNGNRATRTQPQGHMTFEILP